MEKEAKSQVRKEEQDNRLFFLVSKDLIQLLVYGLNPITPRPLPKNKKRDDSIFINVFYDLEITPDIYAETVIGRPRVKNICSEQRKRYIKKRKIPLGWLVQDDGELVEKEVKEKVLEVRT